MFFQELDGDEKKLRAFGKTASRDIVQFVELRKFLGSGNFWSKELLAKDYQYCDLLGNDLLQDCLGEYTNEELKNLKEEDWAIFELKRELKDKVGKEKRHLDSGIKPSSAGKVRN